MASVPFSLAVFTTLSSEEVMKKVETSPGGLSQHAVSERLLKEGGNELTGSKTKWYQVFIRQLYSPFLYLLVMAALVSYFLHEVVDAYMIFLFVAINTLLGFYQEYHSEKTLELLRQFVLAKATVLREGKEAKVESRELVVGDIVLLEPGDVIPADLRFLSVEDLLVDESALTGESVPVRKEDNALLKEEKEIYKARNIGFSGTSILGGSGTGIVIATGTNTSIGQIASLATTTAHKSSFEKGIGSLSSFILKTILITLVIVLVANILIKGGSINIFTLIVFAIALAISVIPEALPVVMTFSLSRGALHLAKHKVVVKRLSAIEDLGSIEVLCSDKTGTLTENVLTFVDCFPQKNEEVLFTAALSTPFDKMEHAQLDPFDSAILHAVSEEKRKLFSSYAFVDKVPFTPLRRRNSVLVSDKKTLSLVVRGASEAVLPLCSLSDPEKKKTQQWVKSQGMLGRRVIAIATKNLTKKPTDLEKEEHKLLLLGVFSFEDPLKKTTLEAMAKAKRLGLRIKILTGDSPDVAGVVAYNTGLIKDVTDVVTGEMFDALDEHEKMETVRERDVFARVSPSQKHAIILLLKEHFEVGFLGEGINDAPALKAANVAIVVQSASDIAREAADIVLLHKSLKVIVDGVHEGREIFGNTIKYIKATLASNFGNFYTVAISSLFITFLPLLPLQILLINLLTDFPMIAVATDTIDPEELKRPKNYDVKEIALFAVIMGAVSTVFDFIFFVLFYRSESLLQTNWFIGSVLTELLFLFAIRTKLPVWKAKFASRPLVLLSCLAFLVAIVLPFTSFGHTVFFFITPSIHSLLLIFAVTICFFVTVEWVKELYYKFVRPQHNAPFAFIEPVAKATSRE